MDLSSITQARYIKLGAKGAWETLCLQDGTLRLNYHEVPYELALQNDPEALRRMLVEDLKWDPRVCSGHIRQVLDFYHAGKETLWVTFSGGYLWWTVTDKPVEYIGIGSDSCPPEGAHLRRSDIGWRKTSLNGTPLHIGDLSGKLTKVASYQQAICNVQAFDYLMHKLCDQEVPQIRAAKQSRQQLLADLQELIRLLTWQDLELFVDLIFSQSGWRRTSSLGGTQKTLDLELILPSTEERAIVQIKSSTNQAQLDDYIEQFACMDADKYFYVYHSGTCALNTKGQNILLMGCEKLAEHALSAGLADWLITKAG